MNWVNEFTEEVVTEEDPGVDESAAFAFLSPLGIFSVSAARRREDRWRRYELQVQNG